MCFAVVELGASVYCDGYLNLGQRANSESMKTLRYAKRLVGFDTTSHKSNQLINQYLELKLTKHGFIVETVSYVDDRGVKKVNLIAKKGGGTGGLAYFGHTDVVPVMNWFTDQFSPFEASVARERLYGRGACDMKGSVACILAATQKFAWDELKQPIYVVLTADEEVGFVGARTVVEESKVYREMVEHSTKVIIGEPTSLEVVHAHKGSVKITATAHGKAAHSSTREGINANLKMIPFLQEMKSIYDETETNPQWQNEHFHPPTLSWNIIVKDDALAYNITPGKSVCTMYLRPMPGIDIAPLLDRVQACAGRLEIDLNVDHWGLGMFVDPQSEFVQQTIKLTGNQTSRTVAYGTDGGVLSELPDKIVFGPGNIAQAHTDDEWISLDQLSQGTEMYEKLIRHWCCRSD